MRPISHEAGFWPLMMFEADVPNALFSQMEGDLTCVDEVLQIEATSAETRETMSQRQNDR